MLVRGYCKFCHVIMSLHLIFKKITPGLWLMSDLCHVRSSTSSKQPDCQTFVGAHTWVISLETNSDDNGWDDDTCSHQNWLKDMTKSSYWELIWRRVVLWTTQDWAMNGPSGLILDIPIHRCTTIKLYRKYSLSDVCSHLDNAFHIKQFDSKSRLDAAGSLGASIQRQLKNTQQRARRISTKASVWASSASQSNIWKHFLSCNNNKTCSIPDFRPSIAASNHTARYGQAFEKRLIQKFS